MFMDESMWIALGLFFMGLITWASIKDKEKENVAK